VTETIAPALDRGRWVISDRFLDSTWAYQGVAGVGRERLEELDRLAVDGIRPDLTLILDLPPETGLARMRSRDKKPDRFERDSLDMHEERRKAYLDIATREPLRCAIVDASADEEAVARAIEAIVEQRLIAGRAGAG
jgi:dTMP kinase